MGMKQWIDGLARRADTITIGTAVGFVADERDGLRKEDATGLSAEDYAEYQRVATKVGFAPRGLKSDALRQFLREAGMRVYPLGAVQAYLDGKYGVADDRHGARWVWKPLRSADGYTREQRDAHAQYIWLVKHAVNGVVAREQAPYGKPVPLPVLLTVERIVEKFPDALFFVSDEYKAPAVPDPFLAVVYGEDSEPVVVERWDEPQFRG